MFKKAQMLLENSSYDEGEHMSFWRERCQPTLQVALITLDGLWVEPTQTVIERRPWARNP